MFFLAVDKSIILYSMYMVYNLPLMSPSVSNVGHHRASVPGVGPGERDVCPRLLPPACDQLPRQHGGHL